MNRTDSEGENKMKALIGFIAAIGIFVGGYLVCHYGLLNGAIQFIQQFVTK